MVKLKRKSNSILLLAPLILSSFILLAPIPLVHATSTQLSVSPLRSIVDVGSMFTVSITVSDIQNMDVFDVNLSFDETQLTYDSSVFGNFPFDFTTTFRLAGSIRAVAGIFGAENLISVPVSDSAVLVSHTFRVDLPGFSDLHISESALGVAFVGKVAHSVSDGTVKSSEKSLVKLNVVRSTGPTVDFGKGDLGAILQTNIANNGPTSVQAFVAWRLIGLSGIPFGLNSATVVIDPGTGVRVDTFFGVEPVPDTFSGTAALLVSEDGATFSIFDVRGMTNTFSVIP